MAKLFSYVLNEYPTLLEATRYSNIAISSDSAVHSAQNTNKVIDAIPGVIASKTGFTDLSGGNLVVVFNAGIMKPVVIALLGSSREGRFSDMQALVNATIQKMAQ
jgi:D-alanyl-D-alanine carboxypeptidase